MTDTTSLPPHIQGLLAPAAYPHRVRHIELRQTHISYLLFAGDVVYKLKKPVDLGFLNFTTLERRRHYCEEELHLNRRLCADTYLDVVPVVSGNGMTRVEAEGEVIDYAVKMRRLPDEGMMTALLERDAVTADHLRLIAERLAEFHGSSERNEEIDRYGGLETALGNWRENFEQTESYIGRTVHQREFDEIRAFVEEVGEEDEQLFAQRVRDGWARDCHGDLRADAVCFVGDGVCIFDCIEFNERFRYSDVASDIAFLAMDLEYRGRQDLSDELMSRYLAGTLDETLPLVLPFYKSYRAYVRAKVDGFQLDQPEIDQAQKRRVAEGVRRYYELACAYGRGRTRRTLILTIGVSGSGKTHLANGLAARLGAAVLSSDVARKRLMHVDPHERRVEAIDSGIYDPDVTERTYRALLDDARRWLEQGRAVILDASYLRRDHRAAALRLAQEMDARFLAVECEADESLIWERLSERQEGRRVVSDGRWEVYKAQQERREPVDELPIGTHMVVETAQPLRNQIDAVVAHLADVVSG